MKTFRMFCLFLNLLMFLSLLSCSGDVGMLAGGGIGGTGVTSTGTITAIGSVWVNGVEFDTQNAGIYVNDSHQGIGDQAVVNNLAVGQVVWVNGHTYEDGSGQADAVFYDSTLTGSIAEIEQWGESGMTLLILGQEAEVNRRTLVQGTFIGDLNIGNLVEMSGFFDNDGRIQATFLSKKADSVLPGEPLRLSGPISNLNENDQTFFINSLIIDYSRADMAAFGSDSLENGRYVQVGGLLENNGGAFTADTVGPYGRLGQSPAGKIEIEGIVRTDVMENKFMLEGNVVEIAPDAKIIWGTLEEILPGTRIEVEGELADGILVAEKITFNALFMAESNLVSKNSLDGSLMLRGMETLTIEADRLTRFKGKANGFDELLPGDHLVVKGWIVDDQTVNATQIFSNASANNKISLRGMMTSFNGRILAVNSVEIDAGHIPSDGFYGTNGKPIAMETFLSMVREGDWIEANGQMNADGLAEWQSLSCVLSQ